MNIYLSNFIHAKYILDIQPDSNPTALLILMVFYIILIVLAQILKLHFVHRAKTLPPYNELLSRTHSTMLTCGIVGIVLIFFRWQELPYLSMRLFTYILILFLIIWSISMIIYYRTTFSIEINKYKNYQKFQQYLPKAKKIGVNLSNKSSIKTMQELVDKRSLEVVPIRINTVMEVTVLAKSKNKILVDVLGLNTGMIPEKEFSADASELKPKDKILASVLSVENDDGLTVLSLKRAEKDRFFKNLSTKFEDQEPITVNIKQANRGGLMAEYGSIEGFLPVSQLASNHYPRVGDDKEKILSKLNELVGKNLKVKILNFDKEANKLIFSEKAAMGDVLKEKIKSFKIGQVIDGKVSGIADFGIFVDLGGIEGLVHISEVSWKRVSNLKNDFHNNDDIRVKIISLDNGKISLSVKKLLVDPWLELIKEYKAGDKVKGKVIKISPFGVFVQLKEGVKGLVHISELIDKIKKAKSGQIEEVLAMEESYNFIINAIDTDNHKINLAIFEENEKKPDKPTKTKSKKSKNKKTKKK